MDTVNEAQAKMIGEKGNQRNNFKGKSIKNDRKSDEEQFGLKFDETGKVIFSELDFESLRDRFQLMKLSCVGDILYMATSMDSYYVKYVGEQLTLFHKNAFKNTKGYHKENLKFETIFNVLGYCKHHYNKHKGLGKSTSYKMSSMEMLFEQIKAK